MLKLRLITALILIPLVLWVILGASLSVFIAVLGAVLAAAAWEWTGLIPVKTPWKKIVYTASVGLFSIALWQVDIQFYRYLSVFCLNVLLLAAVCWLIISYPKTELYWGHPGVTAFWGFWFLTLFGQSLAAIKMMPDGGYYVLYLFLINWAADTGAYFAGKYLGRKKLLPLVSPKKTKEGFVGGMLSALVVVIGAAVFFKLSLLDWGLWIVIGCFTALASVVGDLFVSMLKRHVALKDTGHLLPGHGGVLDRIDSLLISSLVFTSLWMAFF